MLRGKMMDWCEVQWRVSDRPLSYFGDLTLNMLHTKAEGTMTAKGVETRHLMPFISLLLEIYRFSIGERRATHLKGAGGDLTSLGNYFSTMGARPDSRHIRVAYAFYKQFVQFRKLAELPLRPRMHQLAHQVSRAAMLGSPNMHATFEDESLNAVLRSVGHAAHR